MKAGEPDRDDPAERRGSLSALFASALRAARPDRELAAAIAVLIVLGPLATIVGAQLLANHERAQAARIRTGLEPRLAAERTANQARAEMSAAMRRPALGATLEALARGLPADVSLVRAERTGQGLLEADVAVADPDKLRAAIRRDPALARLRDLSQRQSDTAMIVTLREEAP